MLMGNAVALHDIDATGGHIEQHVDQMVRQQIDLVYIKHITVRLRQQTRCKAYRAVLQRLLDIQAADQLLFAEEGRSCRWIARDYGISKNTVMEIVKRAREAA